MIRFVTFVLVLAVLILWFWLTWRPRRAMGAGGVSAPKLTKRPSRKSPSSEFWTQVYDTDSAEEARQIQEKFQSQGIECLLYEQGKKDVYGNLLKRYGVSVPRESVAKAQALLCESTP